MRRDRVGGWIGVVGWVAEVRWVENGAGSHPSFRIRWPLEAVARCVESVCRG